LEAWKGGVEAILSASGSNVMHAMDNVNKGYFNLETDRSFFNCDQEMLFWWTSHVTNE